MLDPAAPRRGRSRPERLAALAALAEPDAGDALEGLVEAAGTVPLAPFAWARNLPRQEIEALADAGGFARFGTGDAAIAVGPERLAQLGERIEAVLAEWHRAQPDALGPRLAERWSLGCAVRHRKRRSRRRWPRWSRPVASCATGRCYGCRSISRGSTATTNGSGNGCGRCSRPMGCGRRACASWPPG